MRAQIVRSQEDQLNCRKLHRVIKGSNDEASQTGGFPKSFHRTLIKIFRFGYLRQVG